MIDRQRPSKAVSTSLSSSRLEMFNIVYITANDASLAKTLPHPQPKVGPEITDSTTLPS